MTRELRLLGFMVKDGKVFPDPDRLGRLSEEIRVESVRELQSVIGLLGFYRHFIVNFSDKAKLIHDTINSKARITEDINLMINKLGKELIESSWLGLPDWSRPFIIEADASDWCLGGVLKQK